MEKGSEIVYMPMVSISPNGIVLYNQYIGPKKCHHFDGDSFDTGQERRKPPTFKTPGGIMSKRASKRMEYALKWLLFISPWKRHYVRELKTWIKFQLTFLTVTLSSKQVHSDNEIKKKMLNQLLVELRKDYNMENYVWRAEKQANGNIHFHIVTNVFIPHYALKKKWNRIQEKLGYIERYQEEMNEGIKCFTDYYNRYQGSASYITLHKRYEEGIKNNWSKPNSTDIHSLKKVNNITAYLCKYMAKETPHGYEPGDDIPDELLVEGKLWGLSESLSSLKTVCVPCDSSVTKEIEVIYQNFQNRTYHSDYFTFIGCDLNELFSLHCTRLKKYILDRLLDISDEVKFKFLYNGQCTAA